MKIAFVDYVCDPAQPGKTGLSDLVWDMASRLARMGDDVHVVAPYTVDRFPDPAVRVHRFRLPPIGYRNIAGHLLIILKAHRELGRLGRLDIIHTPEYTSAALIGSLNKTTPLVFTEPGNIYERLRDGNPYDWSTTQVYKLAARLTARRCAHCIATSESMRAWWQWTGVSEDRITLIPLGVDTALFRPVPGARAALGLVEDQPVILYAARLSRENGVDVTLRAAALLQRELPKLQLHILGDGPERARLRALAEQLGISRATTWHGWVDFRQLPAYYSAADIFAFSGLSGGTPRVLLQAMACGTPVAASAIGGIVDHVRDGESGLLFEPGSPEALAARMRAVLADPRLGRRLGARGQAYVAEQLAWDVLIHRIRALYAATARKTKERYAIC